MYEFSSIFIYFLSIVLVISAMTFVILMTVVHEVSRRRHLLTLMSFCACNFLIQLLYLGMTIQDVLIKYYRYSVYLRVADIVLYTLQTYLWCRYLLFYPLKNQAAARYVKHFCNIVTAITLVLGVYNYAFNIDNKFLYENASAVVIELLCTSLVSIMLVLTIASLKRGVNKRFDTYNIIITALLIFIQWSTDICLVLETKVGFSFSAHEYLTGSLQQILLTLMLVLYVYRTDYSGATLRERLSELLASNKAGLISNASEIAQYAVNANVSSFTASDNLTADTNADLDEDANANCETLTTSDISSDMITANATVNLSGEHETVNASDGFAADNSVTARNTANMPGTYASEQLTHCANTAIEATSTSNSNSNSNSDTNTNTNTNANINATANANINANINSDTFTDIDPIEAIFEKRQLTPREREVARLAYTGLTNPEIADNLCISQYTVKRHMHAVFEKLGISARIELVHLLSGH